MDGGKEPLATATTRLAADQMTYHDPEHPSAILLPIAPIIPITVTAYPLSLRAPRFSALATGIRIEAGVG